MYSLCLENRNKLQKNFKWIQKSTYMLQDLNVGGQTAYKILCMLTWDKQVKQVKFIYIAPFTHKITKCFPVNKNKNYIKS